MKQLTIAALLMSITCSLLAQKPEYKTVRAEKFRPRDGIGNVMQKIAAGQEVTVAYLGGSITAADGWRPQTTAWLTHQYPKAKFKEIHAAIGGTGSDLGVFRVGFDVLQHNPDLLFVEFAVNDGGAQPENIWKSMEGIVRQTWKKNAKTDIMFVYTIHSGMTNDLVKGDCPRSASAMELLADYYKIPSVNFALEITQLLTADKLVFKASEKPSGDRIWFANDDCHPREEGHRIYTAMLAQYIPAMAASKPIDHAQQLKGCFIEDNLENAKMLPITAKMLTGSWTSLAATNSLQKSFGSRMGQLWESGTPGDKLRFTFKGSLAKVYDLVGPNGGKVKVTVDGKVTANSVARFDSYCTYHRIATLGAAANLDPAATHTVEIEILAEQPDRTILLPKMKSPDELKQPKYNGTCAWFSQLMLIGDLAE